MKRTARVSGLRAPARMAPSKKKARMKATPRFMLLRNPAAQTILPSIRTKVIYVEENTINPGAGGSTGSVVYSANGIYDPYSSGVGHQPAGFDQLMAIYGEYVVIGSTIRVMFRATQVDQAYVVGISLTRTNATYTAWAQYCENGDTVWTHLGGRSNGGQTTVTVKHKADIGKLTMSNPEVDPNLSGTSSSNPAEQRFYQIIVGPFDGGSDPDAVQVYTEISYDVIFRDRVPVAIS